MTEELRISRSVVIRARRPIVFRYFTDPERFARWWGEGSTIAPRAGGAVRIVHPGGTTAVGEVLEIEPPARIVFSYGYEDPGRPIPPGGSRVTIALAEHPEGTRVELVHDFDHAAGRDEHAQGWRFQLAVFARVVADEAHSGAEARVDALLASWGEPDARRRRDLLEESVTEEVEFRDAFSCTRGRGDLEAHVAAAAIHMPEVRLRRTSELQHCQGMALAEWEATGADGEPRGRGRSVYALAPDGRIRAATGFWSR
jgi:uncharacterized protein YndB with AHSA1/START domain